jgi:hypothetical protein
MSLVPDHLDPATQAKYESICRKYSVTSDTTWADIKSMVEATKNQNTRRSEIIALRTILGTQGAPSIPAATRKVYSLPTAEEIVRRAEGPYEGFILSMAFAGLRIGEAVALSKTDWPAPCFRSGLIGSQSGFVQVQCSAYSVGVL